MTFSASAMTAYASTNPTLPEGLTWVNNNDQPTWSNPEAKRGGTYYDYILNYPLTMRVVGPSSNNAFATYKRWVTYGADLVQMQPDTHKWVPGIATEWAYGHDNKTIYFKINPKARWSDGEKVTADDWLYTVKFMRSKNIVAPWYNRYYTEKIQDITKYDDYTFSVTAGSKFDKWTLMNTVTFNALPAHFYKNEVPKDYVKRNNWDKPPVTGPYKYGKFQTGKSISLVRIKDWWGNDLKYYKHRYNPDRIVLSVIRDREVAWQHFLRGRLDTYALFRPEDWYTKSNTSGFKQLHKKGYAYSAQFKTGKEAGLRGFFLNTANPLLSQINIRRGLMHAFDVEGMSKTLAYGEYDRMNTLGANHGEYDDLDLKALPYDEAKAREWFAKAGFDKVASDGILMNDKGQRLEFDMLYLYDANSRRMAFYKQQALKAGVDLKLRLQQGASGWNGVMERKYDLLNMGWSTGIIPAYWEYFHSENAKSQTNNVFMVKDEKLDKMIKTFRTSFDLDLRKKTSREIQRRVADLSIFVPSYVNPNRRQVAWNWIKSSPESVNSRTDNMFDVTEGVFWIDPALKEKTLAAQKSGTTLVSSDINLIDGTH